LLLLLPTIVKCSNSRNDEAEYYDDHDGGDSDGGGGVYSSYTLADDRDGNQISLMISTNVSFKQRKACSIVLEENERNTFKTR
jgi:hypothetical protein